MRTDSDRNLSAEADPNPARKTHKRVLTCNHLNQDRKEERQKAACHCVTYTVMGGFLAR
jgi:hypothetical protein